MDVGPWKVLTPVGYSSTLSDNPVFLYQDAAVALDEQLWINNGERGSHAKMLTAANVQTGDCVAHIGAGAGCYAAALASQTGQTGSIDAFEIHPGPAERAKAALSHSKNVEFIRCSGVEPLVREHDVIYVNAGVTHPAGNWLSSLAVGGRMILPILLSRVFGAVFLVRRIDESGNVSAATSISRAMFIPCDGAVDSEAAARLAESFDRGDVDSVRSLHVGDAPDDSCWHDGGNWWLSRREP